MTDYPLRVREEAARLASLQKNFDGFPPHKADTITDTRVGRAFCQYLLETMPVPVDPFEAVMNAVLDAFHYPAPTMECRRDKALAALRCELEARGLLKEPLT